MVFARCLMGAGVDLVLLDYMMPGITEDEVAQKLKGSIPNCQWLSCLPLPSWPQRLLTVIDGYVQKGQDPDVLLGTVSRILKFQSREAAPWKARTPGRKTVLCAEDDRRPIDCAKAGF